MYRIGDVAMVTPLRDGMNLIAKEFVAAKTEGTGVLVLSELAGVASELGEALSVNANDRQAMADALRRALDMPEPEQKTRIRSMQERLQRNDVSRWASDFVSSLEKLEQRGHARRRDRLATHDETRAARDEASRP
jgi:trehalose 6-phosphate synthase/phosphatase